MPEIFTAQQPMNVNVRSFEKAIEKDPVGTFQKLEDDLAKLAGEGKISMTALIEDISRLDFIKDLRPVKFQFRSAVEMPEEVRSYHLSGEESGSLVETSDTGSINYGLIAQEVSSSLSKAGVSDWTGWHENPTTSVQGLSGQSFIYALIKAVQEMSAELSELKAQISGSNDFNTLKTAVSGSS